jgi:CheY-like chemotaxis protein
MKKIRIGIFEGEKVNHFIYERILQQHDDAQFFLFDNAEKGLSLAENISFDIVFIDLHFWGQNFSGISILQKLKETNSSNMVSIAITPIVQDGDLQRAFAGGFGMCIEKPLAFNTIERLLNKLSKKSEPTHN